MRLKAERINDLLRSQVSVIQIEELLADIAVIGRREVFDGVETPFLLIGHFGQIEVPEVGLVEDLLPCIIEEVEMDTERETPERYSGVSPISASSETRSTLASAASSMSVTKRFPHSRR